MLFCWKYQTIVNASLTFYIKYWYIEAIFGATLYITDLQLQTCKFTESSTRNQPGTRDSSSSTTFPKFFDDPQSSDTSFSSRSSSGSSDKATVESAKANAMLKNRLKSNTAPGTPLNQPELQKTDSKRAVVVRKRESVESTENSDSDLTRPEVKTDVETEVHEVEAQPAVPSSSNVASGKQVLQDDQITSTIQGLDLTSRNFNFFRILFSIFQGYGRCFCEGRLNLTVS